MACAGLTVSSAARSQQLGSQTRAQYSAELLVEASRMCHKGTYMEHARAGSCLTRVCSMFEQPSTIEYKARIERKDGGRTKYCNSPKQQAGTNMKHTSEANPLPPNTML